MSRSSHRFGVRNQSRRAQALFAATFESLEGRRYLSSPLTDVIPNTPGASGGLVRVVKGAEGNQSLGLGFSSGSGVRYFDGAAKVAATDFATKGFGMPWGQERSWSNVIGYATNDNTHNGNGWFDTQLPYIADAGSNNVAVILNGVTAEVFVYSASPSPHYTAQNFNQNKLADIGTQFVFTDSTGQRITFEDFSSGTAAIRGAFASFSDRYGNTTSVASRSSGRPSVISRAAGGVTETYTFAYVSGTVNDGLIASVLMEQDSVDVRKVTYDYYDGTDANGMARDLKLATVSDGNPSNVIDRHYYRYYTQRTLDTDALTHNGTTTATVNLTGHGFVTNDHVTISGVTGGGQSAYNGTFTVTRINDNQFTYPLAGAPGSPATGTIKVMDERGYANAGESGLRYSFSARSTARLIATYADYQTRTFAEIAPYADRFFTYFTDGHTDEGKVKTVAVQGAGSTANGGIDTYSYEYSAPGPSPDADPDYDVMRYKTVETQPDGSTNTIYANKYGQVMLRSFAPSAGGNTNRWVTYFKYHTTTGALLQKVMPSAMSISSGTSLFTEGGTTYYTKSSSGLVYDFPYGVGTQGGAEIGLWPTGLGYGVGVRNGTTGDITYREYREYQLRTYGGIDIYLVSAEASLPDGHVPEAGDPAPRTTTYEWDDFDEFGPGSVTITKPAITSVGNGPADGDEINKVFDTFGRERWLKDGDGHITFTTYDDSTGAVTERIVDVDTDLVVDEPWSNATGSHLVTAYGTDMLGRTTRITAPKGDETFIVYNDTAHEVRTYPGWSSTLHTTTGPTQVVREDRGLGYTETLTMTATPNLSDDEPSGAEAIGSVQTLSRRYRTIGGQVAQDDRYFSVPSYATTAHVGVADAHYYATTYEHDDRGRRNKTTLHTGTEQFTAYDELGRVVSKSIGITGETPTVVSMYLYDGATDNLGAVGDGRLTKITRDPGTAADRVTLNYYDWRNRLVATTDDVNDLVHWTDYNEVDEVTARTTYAGDGTTPDPEVKPIDDYRRAKTEIAYDNQGRNFRTTIHKITPSGGSAGDSTGTMATNYYYDHRGNVTGVLEASGLLTASTYDGAGRLETVTRSNDAGGTGWNDIVDLADDVVYEHTDYTHDDNGNLTLTARRDRFHSNNDTLVGALGDRTHGTLGARISYDATVYDAANRPVQSINAGTHSGIAFAAPALPTVIVGTVTSGSSSTLLDTSRKELATWFGSGSTITVHGESRTISSYTPSTHTFVPTSNFSVAPSAGERYVITTVPIADITSTVGASPTTTTITDSARTEVDDFFVGWTLKTGTQTLIVTASSASAHTLTFAPTTPPTESAAYTLTRPDSLAPLSTTYTYNSKGLVETVNHPRLHVTSLTPIFDKTEYDALGRITKTVNNYVNGTPSAADDQTTLYTYDGSDHVTSMTAWLPSFGVQITAWNYAATKGAGSEIDSNDLLSSVRYPNKADGSFDDPEEDEFYTYNALGEVTTYTDRNGSVHEYEYDLLGRMLSDSVTTLDGGADDNVDDSVLRLETTYNDAGRPELFTSRDGATDEDDVVNQVKRIYDGYGNVLQEFQEHDDTVGGSSPDVEYTHDSAGLQTMITYPTEKQVVYSRDDIGRVYQVVHRLDGGTSFVILDQYEFVGLDTVVETTHEANPFDLTYVGTAGSSTSLDQYVGLDQFGRVIDQRYTDGSTNSDRFRYGYDRNGNRLFKDIDQVTDTLYADDAYDELYHAESTTAGYDGLDRLVEFNRGRLEDTNSDSVMDSVVGSPSRYQIWTLDALGNMTSVNTSGSTNSPSYNYQNQFDGDEAYDGNGNFLGTDGLMLDDVYTYDAWNRLVQLTPSPVPSNGPRIIEYDALGRAISERTTQLYYDTSWRVILEQTPLGGGGSRPGPTEGDPDPDGDGFDDEGYPVAPFGLPEERNPNAVSGGNELSDGLITSSVDNLEYVWSPTYIDAMIVRDRNDDASSAGTPDSRVYVQHDANFNTTALVADVGGGTWKVVERYVYDPYGKATTLWGNSDTGSHADWASKAGTTYDWRYRFQGLRYDGSGDGMYSVRFRDYNIGQSRWVQQDPAGYLNGSNLYECLSASPSSLLDPLGLQALVYDQSTTGSIVPQGPPPPTTQPLIPSDPVPPPPNIPPSLVLPRSKGHWEFVTVVWQIPKNGLPPGVPVIASPTVLEPVFVPGIHWVPDVP